MEEYVQTRPEKEDPYRIQITLGGDKINYTGEIVVDQLVT